MFPDEYLDETYLTETESLWAIVGKDRMIIASVVWAQCQL